MVRAELIGQPGLRNVIQLKRGLRRPWLLAPTPAPTLAARARSQSCGTAALAVAGNLGRKHDYTSQKAQTLLDWRPRPMEDTIVDCARSLIAAGAV